MTQPVSTHSWLLVSLSGLTFEEGKSLNIWHLQVALPAACSAELQCKYSQVLQPQTLFIAVHENSSSLYMSKESSNSPVTVHTASFLLYSNLNL